MSFIYLWICVWLSKEREREKKGKKYKMSPGTVRHNCVVCEIQRFSGKFKGGNKVCARKKNGRWRERKRKRKDRQTENGWTREEGKGERKESERWLMEPKSRFLASSDLHYSAISRHRRAHAYTHLAINTHTLSRHLSRRLLVCNQHTG